MFPSSGAPLANPLLELFEQGLQPLGALTPFPNSVEDGKTDDSDWPYTLRLAYDVTERRAVLNALRRWKLRCPKSDLGLVFPAPRGGVLQHTNTQSRFRKLQEQVGVKLRWHDLRHFAVSLWIEQGFSIKEVMTFAGHSSIQMTMERYGHLFPSPDHQNAMAEVEAKLLGVTLRTISIHKAVEQHFADIGHDKSALP